VAPDRPVKVAVLGSGPAGVYATGALVKQTDFPVQVDVFDRVPTPYGLVRYGVAPDHPNIKSIVSVLHDLLASENVRYFGCVELGRDVTRADLLEHYDAVIYATGASVDRHLGIPGEDLPGSYPATEFVAWYSGHPDARQPFPLDDIESVVVIGVGNVALDVARMLAKTPEDLAQTDTPSPVLTELGKSTVHDIHIVGRRGPEHAKFTTKELRELGELANASVQVVPAEVAVDPDVELERLARTNVAVLQGWVENGIDDKARRVSVRFWLRPDEIVGTDKVTGLRCERAVLDESGTLVGTGEFETIPADVVLRAAGYRSLPLPGVAFDDANGVIPNAAGRVLDAAGNVSPHEYVAGWVKRGPTGVIGTNKSDATETVRNLIEDVNEGRIAAGPALPSFDEQLSARGVQVVDFAGWLRIDAEEIRRGEAEGRPRSKISDWESLISAAGS